MSRSKHQFRPGAIEVFETRIVPTVIAIPGTPFVPPGHAGPSSPVDVTPTTYPDGTVSHFTVDPVNTNQINAPRVTNNDPNDIEYVTIAVYTAPGGGNGTPNPTGSENLRSQSLLKVIGTFAVPAGAVNYQLPPESSFDASQFDQQGPGSKGNHFTGDDEFQCDMFEAPDQNGYAPPNKLSLARQDIPLVIGDLFQYLDAKNGKKK